jgi:hypothetical protein
VRFFWGGHDLLRILASNKLSDRCLKNCGSFLEVMLYHSRQPVACANFSLRKELPVLGVGRSQEWDSEIT